jgi:DNA-binding response OmpR family regulator
VIDADSLKKIDLEIMADTPENKLKLLLVEDDEFLQKILLAKFIKEGFDVEAASDGEKALEMLHARMPQLLLLDLILPKMTGFDVLSEIRMKAETKNLPVIILSNLGQEEDIRRGKDLGALDFLVKADISVNDVVRRVKELYAKHNS